MKGEDKHDNLEATVAATFHYWIFIIQLNFHYFFSERVPRAQGIIKGK